MHSLIQLKTVFLVALTCFGLSPGAQAVVPAPDGGYPGGNTAEGQNALFSRTTGGYNTAIGFLSLRSDTTNSFNTAIGAGALLANTADQNTATGAGALFSNTTGQFNTANGAFALFSNTTGSINSAFGWNALEANTTGHDNTAIGLGALFRNTTGQFNTALGDNALVNNTTGGDNTALGFFAGISNTTASNVICIGANVDGLNISDTTWISGIYATTTVSGTTLPVIVSDSGQLGTTPSSRRFKKEIKPMDKTSEAILALRPVTFHYKSDKTSTPQFGLIAEEVAEVNPNLVVRDKNGEIYTVRYDAVNAMLLNEFLKEHKKVERQQANITELNARVAKQEALIADQRKGMEALTAQLKKQAAQIQKVSAQLETTKAAQQVAENNQ
jgi:uncharacterized coiled-coil protein SlyX